MIFYTLQGPKYRLEIHDDKIKLVKKSWLRFFGSSENSQEWKLNDLSKFEIVKPKFIWGKLEWATDNGNKCSFRFSTNAVMMNKIEKYMHRLIIKNFQKRQAAVLLPFKQHKNKVAGRKKGAMAA